MVSADRRPDNQAFLVRVRIVWPLSAKGVGRLRTIVWPGVAVRNAGVCGNASEVPVEYWPHVSAGRTGCACRIRRLLRLPDALAGGSVCFERDCVADADPAASSA